MTEVDYIDSKVNIHKNLICNKCPLKVYNNKGDNVMYGIGNIFANTIMILPPYDINDKTILDVLANTYSEITDGRDLYEDNYITRFIKCSKFSQYNISTENLSSCYAFLSAELSDNKYSKVISFGENYWHILGNYGHKVYSPLVMLYDNEDIKQEFIKQLKKAIYE